MNISQSQAGPFSFTLGEKQEMARCLHRLAEQISAPLVMVADVSGRLVLFHGRLPGTQSTGLAALSAASFAAAQEMGCFLGLRDGFDQQLHEGTLANLYILAVGADLLLIVAFRQSTMLGLVRLFAQQTQQELLELASQAGRAQEAKKGDLEMGFGTAVNERLEALFPGNGYEYGHRESEGDT